MEGTTDDAKRLRRGRAIRLRRHLAVLLAAVAGSVDAIGYLTLFHLFTAHMTGNTVAMSAQAGLGDWHEALRRAFVIPTFVAGVVVGRAAMVRADRRGYRASFLAPFALEASLLVAFAVAGAFVDLGRSVHALTLGYFALAVLPALAMGVQASTVRRIADHGVRTTFVTGMLTTLGEQLVGWATGASDGARRMARARAGLVSRIWAAYAVAAIAAAAIERPLRFAAVLLPLLGLAAAALVDWRAALIRRDTEESA